MKLNFPNPSSLMDEVESRGFSIVKNCIPEDFISSQKDKQLPRFERKNVDKKFVRGNLILGERNFLSYSNTNSWCMFRNFEFLWNASDDYNNLNAHILIHKFRNQMQNFNEEYGLSYNSKNYGMYISTSYYPLDIGRLAAHTDGHKDVPILHYMLPLTFKGRDYEEGGLYLKDTSGNIVDVDSMMDPGDIIFFDGRQEHWVDVIKSNKQTSLGRLAVFAIPTHFIVDSWLEGLKRSIIIHVKEILSGIGLIKLG